MHEDGTGIYDSPTEAAKDLVKRAYVITTMPAPPPASLAERIKQLSWTRVNRHATKATCNSTRGTSYKDKLRTFQRTTPGASTD